MDSDTEDLTQGLPDEMLLEVFDRLDSRDLLLGVRAVCSRWRHLARSPALWSSRSAVAGSRGKAAGFALGRAVLLWAPCLRNACVGTSHLGSLRLDEILGSCAVRGLTLSLQEASATQMAEAHLALLRQVELGRLVLLDLDMGLAESSAPVLAAALKAGLTNLFVRFENLNGVAVPELPLEEPAEEVAPSIKYLVYFSHTRDAVLLDLLRTHAAALVKVEIGWRSWGRAVELLQRCPRLQKARVPHVAEVACLGQCPLITDLHLAFTLRPGPSALEPFFREAVRLTVLKLYDGLRGSPLGGIRMMNLPRCAMELLVALASSRRSALQKLLIGHRQDPEDLLLLPAALAGLPLLHTLEVHTRIPAEALDTIAPRNAPSLRHLKLNLYQYPWLCPSGEVRCYLSALVSLAKRISQLHVSGFREGNKYGFGYDDEEDCECGGCDCCLQGFHHKFGMTVEGLFGHGLNAECSLPEHKEHDNWASVL